jgi:predicted RNA-binding protein with EMAP domain
MTLRFITKHFVPNYTKLRDFDRVIGAHIEPAIRPMGIDARTRALKALEATSSPLKTSESSYLWVLHLSHDDIESLVAEWKGKFQAVAQLEASAAARTRAQLPTHRGLPGMATPVVVDLAFRVNLLSNTSKNKDLFEGLQRIKYRYQEIAAGKQKSSFKKITEDLKAMVKRVDDSVHQNAFVGKYLTLAEELERTYERATEHGTANELQLQIVQAGGLYQVAKSAFKIGKAVGEVMSGVGVVSGAKKLAEGVGNIINVAGGLIKGVTDKLRGREADYRRLTAQLGVEKALAQKKKELMGQTQESIGEQVVGGTDRLHRGAALFKAELDKMEHAIRHSLWWVNNWQMDLAVLEREFKGSDPESYTCVLVKLFKQNTDSAVNKDEKGIRVQEVVNAENEVRVQMEKAQRELTPKIDELRVNLKRMNDMLVQDLRIIAEHRAAVETRMAISAAQTRSVTADRQYNQHQRLANELAARVLTGPKLRSHLIPRTMSAKAMAAAAPTQGSLAQAAASAVSTLRPASDRVLAPKPVTSMSLLQQALARRRAMIEPTEDDDFVEGH